jgi:hypothetical protein
MLAFIVFLKGAQLGVNFVMVNIMSYFVIQIGKSKGNQNRPSYKERTEDTGQPVNRTRSDNVMVSHVGVSCSVDRVHTVLQTAHVLVKEESGFTKATSHV